MGPRSRRSVRLRLFLTLAEEQHFARTAERLGLTKSRVSQGLRDLERKLGEPLLYRTSRRVMRCAPPRPMPSRASRSLADHGNR